MILFRWLALWLRGVLRAVLRPPRPSRPSVRLLREVNDMLVYKVAAAPPGVSDVVTQEISVVVDGGEPTVTLLPLLPLGGSFEVSFADNASVTITQVDIDDAGNRSDVSPAAVFTATDAIPPPAPGAPTVELLREE